MPRLIFSLTDADQEALEELRVARGLRSQAEVLRTLIRENTAGGVVTVGVVETPPPTKTVDITPAMAKPFKSRLKGEWKAP